MNILTLLLSSFIEHNARGHAEMLREAGYRAAEKGVQVAIASLGVLVAAGFFFAGCLLAVIEMGLQIDRKEFYNYSGLMISATTLVALGFISALASYLSVRESEPPPPPPPPKSELISLLESVAVTFIRDFQQSQRRD